MGWVAGRGPIQTLPRAFLIPIPRPAHLILVVFGSHPEFAERHWSPT
jgi:hypothetical protein